jgi:methyl acetate hydrolase
VSADPHQDENMSASVHSAIDEVLEQAVDSGAVPNVVAIAADREGIIYEGGAGPRAPGQSATVDADTRFRIMSMTKMVATVAALQLSEQSKLDLDAPVEEYCPDFAEVQVLERVDGGTPVLRAPASKATRTAPGRPRRSSSPPIPTGGRAATACTAPRTTI